VAGEKNVFLNMWLASWQDWVNPEFSYPSRQDGPILFTRNNTLSSTRNNENDKSFYY